MLTDARSGPPEAVALTVIDLSLARAERLDPREELATTCTVCQAPMRWSARYVSVPHCSSGLNGCSMRLFRAVEELADEGVFARPLKSDQWLGMYADPRVVARARESLG